MTQEFPQSWFFIKNQNGLVLTAPQPLEGANIIISALNANSPDTQLWRQDGEGHLINKGSNMVMEIAKGNIKAGTEIVQHQIASEKDKYQKFGLTEDGRICPKDEPSFVVAIKESFFARREGLKAHLQSADKPSKEQQWTFLQPVLKSETSEYYEVKKSSGDFDESSNSSNREGQSHAISLPAGTFPDQDFFLKSQSGLYIGVDSSSLKQTGGRLTVEELRQNDYESQMWSYESSTGHIVNKHSGYVLTAESLEEEGYICQADKTDEQRQAWVLSDNNQICLKHNRSWVLGLKESGGMHVHIQKKSERVELQQFSIALPVVNKHTIVRRFGVFPPGELFIRVNAGSERLALTVEKDQGSKSEGYAVALRQLNLQDLSWQLWRHEEGYLVHVQTGLVLDASVSEQLHVRQKSQSESQLWALTPNGEIHLKSNELLVVGVSCPENVSTIGAAVGLQTVRYVTRFEGGTQVTTLDSGDWLRYSFGKAVIGNEQDADQSAVVGTHEHEIALEERHDTVDDASKRVGASVIRQGESNYLSSFVKTTTTTIVVTTIVRAWRITFIRRCRQAKTKAELLAAIEKSRLDLYERLERQTKRVTSSTEEYTASVQQVKETLKINLFDHMTSRVSSIEDDTEVNIDALDIQTIADKSCTEASTKVQEYTSKQQSKQTVVNTSKNTSMELHYAKKETLVAVASVRVSFRYYLTSFSVKIAEAKQRGASEQELQVIVQEAHQKLKNEISQTRTTIKNSKSWDLVEGVQSSVTTTFDRVETILSEEMTTVSSQKVYASEEYLSSWIKSTEEKLSTELDTCQKTIITKSKITEEEKTEETTVTEEETSVVERVTASINETKTRINTWYMKLVKELQASYTIKGLPKEDTLSLIDAAQLELEEMIDEARLTIKQQSSQLSTSTLHQYEYTLETLQITILASLVRFKKIVQTKEVSQESVHKYIKYTFGSSEHLDEVKKIDHAVSKVCAKDTGHEQPKKQPEQPKTSVKPQHPEQPKINEKPQHPEQPKTSVKPQQPEQPKTSEKPQHPEQPKTSEKPQQSDQPKHQDAIVSKSTDTMSIVSVAEEVNVVVVQWISELRGQVSDRVKQGGNNCEQDVDAIVAREYERLKTIVSQKKKTCSTLKKSTSTTETVSFEKAFEWVEVIAAKHVQQVKTIASKSESYVSFEEQISSLTETTIKQVTEETHKCKTGQSHTAPHNEKPQTHQQPQQTVTIHITTEQQALTYIEETTVTIQKWFSDFANQVSSVQHSQDELKNLATTSERELTVMFDRYKSTISSSSIERRTYFLEIIETIRVKAIMRFSEMKKVIVEEQGSECHRRVSTIVQSFKKEVTTHWETAKKNAQGEFTEHKHKDHSDMISDAVMAGAAVLAGAAAVAVGVGASKAYEKHKRQKEHEQEKQHAQPTEHKSAAPAPAQPTSAQQPSKEQEHQPTSAIPAHPGKDKEQQQQEQHLPSQPAEHKHVGHPHPSDEKQPSRNEDSKAKKRRVVVIEYTTTTITTWYRRIVEETYTAIDTGKVKSSKEVEALVSKHTKSLEVELKGLCEKAKKSKSCDDQKIRQIEQSVTWALGLISQITIQIQTIYIQAINTGVNQGIKQHITGLIDSVRSQIENEFSKYDSSWSFDVEEIEEEEKDTKKQQVAETTTKTRRVIVVEYTTTTITTWYRRIVEETYIAIQNGKVRTTKDVESLVSGHTKVLEAELKRICEKTKKSKSCTDQQKRQIEKSITWALGLISQITIQIQTIYIQAISTGVNQGIKQHVNDLVENVRTQIKTEFSKYDFSWSIELDEEETTTISDKQVSKDTGKQMTTKKVITVEVTEYIVKILRTRITTLSIDVATCASKKGRDAQHDIEKLVRSAKTTVENEIKHITEKVKCIKNSGRLVEMIVWSTGMIEQIFVQIQAIAVQSAAAGSCDKDTVRKQLDAQAEATIIQIKTALQGCGSFKIEVEHEEGQMRTGSGSSVQKGGAMISVSVIVYTRTLIIEWIRQLIEDVQVCIKGGADVKEVETIIAKSKSKIEMELKSVCDKTRAKKHSSCEKIIMCTDEREVVCRYRILSEAS
ncbi:hypothetical protein BX666DRAFT_74407 [Dichotomocladium elegans]|nr:hypothetical protein BX666DRAFT_74407 [Dichotomocladium elegans]